MTGALNGDPGLATGPPGPFVPVPATMAMIGAPTTSQAPPSAATKAPLIAAGPLAASSTLMPPTKAAGPGTTDTPSLPLVYVPVVPGAYPQPQNSPPEATMARPAPSPTST